MIEFLKEKKEDFTVTKSSYTTTIQRENGEKHFYSEENSGNHIFSLYAKLKKEIKNSQIEVDDFPIENISFFNIDPLHLIEYNNSNLINIDIKSAYPTAAKNLGLISEEFYKTLMRLNKGDRLKLIGMLASEPITIIYKFGTAVDMIKKKENEFIPYWKIICYEIGEKMNICKDILGPDYLFFWVDGIYLSKDSANAEKVINYLKKENYLVSVDLLKNFKVNQHGQRIYVEYQKGEDVKKFSFSDGTTQKIKKSYFYREQKNKEK
jgi:hypothetical protein